MLSKRIESIMYFFSISPEVDFERNQCKLEWRSEATSANLQSSIFNFQCSDRIVSISLTNSIISNGLE